jgi:hypothetical protein
VSSLCHECSEISVGRGSTDCYIPNQQNLLRAMDFNTPIEMLTGTTSFKVPPKKFRCVCFVHNMSSGTSKLDAKSHKCVFVRYSSGKKGYKCYDPVKKRMLESLDVTFRDTEPYFVLLNAQSNASPVTFQDTLEVVVTLPSDRVGREGEHRVSDNGMKDTMDLSDTMDVSPNTSSSTSVELRADLNLPPPTKQIKCTLENLVMRMLSNRYPRSISITRTCRRLSHITTSG